MEAETLTGTEMLDWAEQANQIAEQQKKAVENGKRRR